jgi:hypothetical protein
MFGLAEIFNKVFDAVAGVLKVVVHNPAYTKGKTIPLFSAEQWVVPAGGTITKTSGSVYETGEWDGFEVYINATNVSGATAPSLVFTLKVSPDGGTTWFSFTAYTALNSVTSLPPIHVTGRHPLIRIDGVCTGDNADTITANVWLSGIPKG